MNKMNKGLLQVLKDNIGKGVIVDFNNVCDSQEGGYDMGLIEEVSDEILKLKYRLTRNGRKSFFHRPSSSQTQMISYIDVSSIRSIRFSDPDLFDENEEYRK
jgi:hypothetical protein